MRISRSDTPSTPRSPHSRSAASRRRSRVCCPRADEAEGGEGEDGAEESMLVVALIVRLPPTRSAAGPPAPEKGGGPVSPHPLGASGRSQGDAAALGVHGEDLHAQGGAG